MHISSLYSNLLNPSSEYFSHYIFQLHNLICFFNIFMCVCVCLWYSLFGEASFSFPFVIGTYFRLLTGFCLLCCLLYFFFSLDCAVLFFYISCNFWLKVRHFNNIIEKVWKSDPTSPWALLPVHFCCCLPSAFQSFQVCILCHACPLKSLLG